MARDPSPSDPLEAIRSALRAEAERSPVGASTTFEQVKALLPEIEALRARRRTTAEIRDLLVAHGIDVKVGTLSQYIAKAKREANGDEAASNKSATRRERRVKADTNAKPNASPKPSELAGASPATPREGGKALGHKLNDDDV